MSGIRLLPGMKFMSGGVLYRPGDILPDTESARDLVRLGKAQEIEKPATTGTAAEALIPAAEENSGDYESQSVKALVDLTKERGIDIPKGTNKAGIIELLEAWDAAHAEDGDEGGA
jgi:hypothetical protein